MPLINQPNINIGDIAANPYWDMDTLVTFNLQIRLSVRETARLVHIAITDSNFNSHPYVMVDTLICKSSGDPTNPGIWEFLGTTNPVTEIFDENDAIDIGYSSIAFFRCRENFGIVKEELLLLKPDSQLIHGGASSHIEEYGLKFTPTPNNMGEQIQYPFAHKIGLWGTYTNTTPYLPSIDCRPPGGTPDGKVAGITPFVGDQGNKDYYLSYSATFAQYVTPGQ